MSQKRTSPNPPLVTLTTDFGTASPYVAAMKGVLLSIHPGTTILDLSHHIPCQDVRHADQFLAQAIPYFPAETIHVVVVDPGVGTSRRILLIEAGGQVLLGPDNGCLTSVVRSLGGGVVRQVSEPRYWRASVSDTFHGRDILAPVAAHLSTGVAPTAFGPVITDWHQLAVPVPRRESDRWIGEVVFVDDFGNLLTNLTREHLAPEPTRIELDGHVIPVTRVRTYGDARAGELVWLFSSSGQFEIAIVNGNAAATLQVRAGARVELS